MKQKLSFLLAGLLIMGAMTGCAAQAKSTETAYISRDSACTAALTAAGVEVGSANITAAQLSEKDGIPYYEVDFTASGTEYSYSIDAVTGIVIESQNKTTSESGGEVTDYDTSDNRSAANPAGDTVTDYDTANTGNNTAANAANPPATKAPAAPAPSTGTAKEITLEQAKQAALEHAGKTGTFVTFVKAHKDFDNGQWIYEIEFVVQSGNSYHEYDYEISASTGKVLSCDYDAESYASPKQDSTTKTEDEVRKIALAKVPGAKASDCSLWLDQDDGRLLYEGKIIYNQMEYEFEIDAYSGTILDWEAESIYD